MARDLSEIAQDIMDDWARPDYTAAPYLEAMFELKSLDDYYGADDAESIVLYFLNNAGKWRGPVAQSIKLELKKMLSQHGRRASSKSVLAKWAAPLDPRSEEKKAARSLVGTTRFGPIIKAFDKLLDELTAVRPGELSTVDLHDLKVYYEQHLRRALDDLTVPRKTVDPETRRWHGAKVVPSK